MDGFEFFSGRSDVVAMICDDRLLDLSESIPSGKVPEPIELDSPHGLDILRHSCAHVLAQAVQSIYGDAKLGIGPFTENGFYYDFSVNEPFSSDSLRVIEDKMREIVHSDQKFVRKVVDRQSAHSQFRDEPFKLEIINATDDTLSIYYNIDADSGSVRWMDFCRGPHLPSTRFIGDAFALTHVSSVYWRGNSDNPQMQRVYGTAWGSAKDLKGYLDRVELAKLVDHRKLGKELDLFSLPDEIGPGLALFHVKGGIIRSEMEQYARLRHLEEGYNFVYSPHITKRDLFERSGHLQWYGQSMFPPMRLDKDSCSQGFDYYLKPMNCPFHSLVFSSQPRSYRQLPLRLAEFGTVYRYEQSGAIHGLARVRGLTQDDAHIYATRESFEDEVSKALQFTISLLGDYGLDQFYIEISTRDASGKFLGSDEDWAYATHILQKVAQDSGLQTRDDPGGAAFYGPKISVQAKDAIGRYWQMSTIQLDFNLPERFGLFYTDRAGERKRPIMVHRALFGSFERFFAVLTEHYAGAFPPWLSPEQVVALPVTSAHIPYLEEFVSRFSSRLIRARVDYMQDRLPKKIRSYVKEKIPFVLVAGDRDLTNRTVAIRFRDGTQISDLPIQKCFDGICASIDRKKQIQTRIDFDSVLE
ncbi:MAG: threonine--tRNA ligase [Tropheryma whipplei]|uniref:Threonine--tRNA ligase n=1 Tax=Tropheryma whipplei (strain Twist) TaxID=203267 RepID=SYT_TROWT|nr:threonine--tRNA ligase [Tropheryma whipplei]Q83GK5.1 RecName: Full=Threonine--tRNA ligase; AltName: Full=Threonyl-tRNA synthetase; Short=ThrRS [Tropheryma whipplei str. Twist]AAO44359.1 threonyl-tRNA synthetase [Tropheryma whipplei str. Twist]MCO8182624.1 threonine--tRNA ligase [Tropheryma whipplei]